MRKTKVLTALLCVFVLCLSVFGFTACKSKGEDSEKNNTPSGTTRALTDGVFDGTYTANGYKQDTYIRFHEEGEILEGKRTFYYHAYSGEGAGAMAQVAEMLGVYEVSDEPITLHVASSPSQRTLDNADLTANQTITFKSLDGTVTYFKTGYDAENGRLLGVPGTGYNPDNANNMGVVSYYCDYCYLQTEEPKTDHGIALESFYADVNDVRNASIIIYHNGTYADNKVTGSDNGTGTWTKNGSAYTLTAGTSGLKSGTLVISGSSAAFTPSGESEIAMSNTRNRTAVYTLTGISMVDNGQGGTLEASIALILNDDNSAIISSEAAGQATVVEGTWNEIEGAILVSNSLLDGNAILSETKEDSSYVLQATLRLANGAQFTVKTAPYDKETELLYTFTGRMTVPQTTTEIDVILELYSDGSAKWTNDLPENFGGRQVLDGDWEATDGKPTMLTLVALPDAPVTISEEADGVFSATLNGTTVTTAVPQQAVYTLTNSQYSGQLLTELVLYNDGSAVYETSGAYAPNGGSSYEGTWSEKDGEPEKAVFSIEGIGTIEFAIAGSYGAYTATTGEGQTAQMVTNVAYTFMGKAYTQTAEGYVQIDTPLYLLKDNTAVYLYNGISMAGTWAAENDMPVSADVSADVGGQTVSAGFTISESEGVYTAVCAALGNVSLTTATEN